jgi:hypothetical protein
VTATTADRDHRLYRQQFGDGEVEAHCEDGVVLRSGHVAAAQV